MEERKLKEIELYNKKAKNQDKMFNPLGLEGYVYFKNICENKISGKKILDYGCGNGIHAEWLTPISSKLLAIDLSKESLKVAKERVISEKAEFIVMDCEKLEFENENFDVVFDGGSLSSLDVSRSFPEIFRVLKPEGIFIGIETLGHNPLINFKRLIGGGTDWAINHIFKMKDLALARQYFKNIEVHYFHLISWVAIPFLKYPFGISLLRILEKTDHLILRVLPFLKRYCFKIVFIMSNPKKYDEEII